MSIDIPLEDVIRIRLKTHYLYTIDEIEKDLKWALNRIDELKEKLNDKNERKNS